MRKLHCEDCGCVLEKWSTVWRWPEDGQDVFLCQWCMESRVDELRTEEIAVGLGATCQEAGEMWE